MSNEQRIESDTSNLHETQKILGVDWNFKDDCLLFNVAGVSGVMNKMEPTKRNVVSLTTRFFDPLGIVSPVTVLFKMFFQELCRLGLNWDDALTGDQLKKWSQLKMALSGPKTLTVPRQYFNFASSALKDIQLIGFCDASSKAYAAVVYIKAYTEEGTYIKFITAKTRVTPLKDHTIPRLELLAAVLLSRLIVSVKAALKSELSLGDSLCYTDSKVALYWICGHHKEWKQFVENRVQTIRSLVPPELWRHCPGRINPADAPSRGTTMTELLENETWFNGPKWLYVDEEFEEPTSEELPEECAREMKGSATQLIAETCTSQRIGLLIQCDHFSSLNKLLRVTGLVIKFIRLISNRNSKLSLNSISLGNVDLTRLYWIQESQRPLIQDLKFSVWKHQFNVILDEQQIWRCEGRMANSDLAASAQRPILLHKEHYLTKLIVMNSHLRTLHGGVKDTLTDLQSAYWLIKGRQFIRQLIHRCTICRKSEGMPYKGVAPPPLPRYRVQRSRPFCYTGVDFAGPMYVRSSINSHRKRKGLDVSVYVCSHKGSTLGSGSRFELCHFSTLF
jgi:hypothetical protein